MRISNPYKYSNGYIFLPLRNLNLDNLHPTIVLFGDNYYLKSEFHVSLICVKEALRENPLITEANIVDIFNGFVGKISLQKVEYLDEYRIATHPDGRKSIIQKVNIRGVEGLFTELRKKIHITINTQPLHVTIYTLQGDRGIGISNIEDYNNTLEIRFR